MDATWKSIADMPYSQTAWIVGCTCHRCGFEYPGLFGEIGDELASCMTCGATKPMSEMISELNEQEAKQRGNL